VFLPQDIFKKNHHLGLSITPSAVRAVVVDSPTKVDFKREVIADELLLDGETVNIPKLTSILKTIREEIGHAPCYAACCFPEKLAYTREHIFPLITTSEITEAINWQLGTIFPFKPEDVYADWKLIRRTNTETVVVVSAANKKLIDGLVASCNAAGIKPLSFESSAAALARAISTKASQAIIIELDNFGSSSTFLENGIASLTATTNFVPSAPAQEILGEIITTLNQLQNRLTTPAPIYITGEKAKPEVVSAISQQLGQDITILESDTVPTVFQPAYIESITTIDAPRSDHTINLLPNTIEKLYYNESDISQAKVVAKYTIGMSLAAFVITLLIFLISLIFVNQSTQQLTSAAESPSPPADINLSQYMQTSQKIVQLQAVELYPRQHFDALANTIDPSTMRQFSYDATKKIVKISLGPTSRDQIFSLKTTLENTDLFSQISIPLSALNSDQTEGIILTLTLKDAIK
jgi:hypothetical protein